MPRKIISESNVDVPTLDRLLSQYTANDFGRAPARVWMPEGRELVQENSGSDGIVSRIFGEIKGLGSTMLDAVNLPKAAKTFYQSLKRDDAAIRSVEALVENNASIQEIRGKINEIPGAINRVRARNAAQAINPDLKRSELRMNDDYETNINFGIATYWGRQKEGVNRSQVSSDFMGGINLFSKLAFSYAAVSNPLSLAGTLYGFRKADQGARYLAERSSSLNGILDSYEGKSVALGNRTIQGKELRNVIKNFYSGSYSTIATAAYFLANAALALKTGNLSAALIPLARGGVSGLTAAESYRGMRDISSGNFGEGTVGRMTAAKDLQALNTALYAASATSHLLPSVFDIAAKAFTPASAYAQESQGATQEQQIPDPIEQALHDINTGPSHSGTPETHLMPSAISTHEHSATTQESRIITSPSDISTAEANLSTTESNLASSEMNLQQAHPAEMSGFTLIANTTHKNTPWHDFFTSLGKYDANNDGRISMEEIVHIPSSFKIAYTPFFENGDTDHSNFIEIGEAERYVTYMNHLASQPQPNNIEHKTHAQPSHNAHQRPSEHSGLVGTIAEPFIATGSAFYHSLESGLKSISNVFGLGDHKQHGNTATGSRPHAANEGQGANMHDAKTFLDDYHKVYMHNYMLNQREHIGGGDLRVDGNKLVFNFTDPNYAAHLDSHDDAPKLGFVPHEGDVVVRIFRHNDGTPIAIADLDSNGISEGITLRPGMTNLSDQQILNGITSGRYFAEATVIDRNGTYGDCPTNRNGFGNDEVFIFDRTGGVHYGGHVPRGHAPPTRVPPVAVIGTPDPGTPDPIHPPTRVVPVVLPRPDFEPQGIIDGSLPRHSVEGLINYTTDRGWEGFQGRHPASELRGKGIVINSGDHIGVGPSDAAAEHGYDTHTRLLHSNENPVYGRETLPSKIKNAFLPYDHEWERYRIANHQDGQHGQPIVLDGNNGIYGTHSHHPDEARFHHRKYETVGGHTVAGHSHTLLGGVHADDLNNHRNRYLGVTDVSHKTSDGQVKFDGSYTQRIETDPMRNSTAYGAGVLTGIGISTALPHSNIIRTHEVIKYIPAAPSGPAVPGLGGGQGTGPGIVGGQ